MNSDYTWADAWFLLAVSYVSPQGEWADLQAVIGAADFINHAILTHSEIQAAACKLTRDGWLQYEQQQFAATPTMIERFDQSPKTSPMERMEFARRCLNAGEYESGYDPNAPTEFEFHDITSEMVSAAVQDYKNGVNARGRK